MIKLLKECQYINIQDLKYFERSKGKIKLGVDGLWHDANVKCKSWIYMYLLGRIYKWFLALNIKEISRKTQ